MTTKDAYIGHLGNTIKDLQGQASNLTEMVMILRREKFGSSSEETPKQIKGQLSLFNGAELEASDPVPEPIKKDVRGYARVNAGAKREELIKNLPVREIPCESAPEDQTCPGRHPSLRPLGKETVREELGYIPAKLQIARYVRMSYECPKCRHTDHPYIQKALTPTSLLNHSLASPSSVANVVCQKYVDSVPLYRQEKDWEQMGISLSRATMANWVVRCSQDYPMPVVGHLRKELLSGDTVHCDETPARVLKEEGKKPQAKSYMRLYRTGDDEKAPIVLYDYQPSRNGDHAVTYLKDFKGYVHSDGFSGCNKLKDITRCGCWAHLRRKLVEAVPARKSRDASLTSAETGRDYCNRLFKIEDRLKDLSPDERFHKRLELEKPALEAFWCWLESLTFPKGSALGKAVAYAKNQKPYMENYLLDGRLAISNNAAENAIRPFTVGRKNWLFADTPKGAAASAAAYSLIETAKANGLNVYTYLEYLLLYMPDTDWLNDPAQLDCLMPWSESVQAECKR